MSCCGCCARRGWGCALSDLRAVTLAQALGALRLNRHFPPWERVQASVQAMGELGALSLDPSAGMPAGTAWMRLNAELAEAEASLTRLRALGPLPEPEASRVRVRQAVLERLRAVEPVPLRQVHVALRHREGDRASWRVVVDRLDLSTATLARYSLVVGGRPGRHVSDGDLELQASEGFQRDLEVLAAEDAALAFALLRQRGLDVSEVVRGQIGPALLPGAGPVDLGLAQGALSACLERASVDLQAGQVDDPLAQDVVLPGARSGFGLSASRKWAVHPQDRPALAAWLRERGSRGLVYSW